MTAPGRAHRWSPRSVWRAWPTWLQLTGVGALAFLTAAVGWRLTDSGTLPEWLAATATVAALIAAVVAARNTWETLLVERGRDEDRRQEQDRAQADRIAVWVNEYLTNNRVVDGIEEPIGFRGIVVSARNPTDLPVRSLVILGFLEHDNRPPEPLARIAMTMLVPGDAPERFSAQFASGSIDMGAIGVDGSSLVDRFVLELYFTDAAGRRWRRNSRGELTRHEGPELLAVDTPPADDVAENSP